MTDPVPSKKALPCPFCGSTDVTVEQGDTFRWRVAVCVCGVRGPDVRVQTMGEGNPKQWDAQGEIDALEAWNKRAAPEPAAEWQPIELAPKDGRSFLAVRGGAPFICRWGAGANIWQQDSGEWRDPKYWMPLPARPAQPPRDGE